MKLFDQNTNLRLMEKWFPMNKSQLNEGDSRMEKAFSMIDDIMGTKAPHLDLNAKVNSPEYMVNNNPNTTWRDYIYYHFRHTFGLMGNNAAKIVRKLVPIVYGDDVQFEWNKSNGDENVDKLSSYVEFILQDPKETEWFNTQCQCFSDLVNRYQPIVDKMQSDEMEKSRLQSEQGLTRNEDYEIRPFESMEEAYEMFGKYTGVVNEKGEYILEWLMRRGNIQVCYAIQQHQTNGNRLREMDDAKVLLH